MLCCRTIASVFFALALVAAACGGEPPDKEMQQAQQSIEAARAAGAPRYAAEEFTAAEDALKQARTAVGQRDFRLALNHALDSRERAEAARAEAAVKMAAARTETERAIVSARATLNAARERLKTVESGRAPAVVAARQSVDIADQRVQEAGTAFAADDYVAANTATVAAMQALAAAHASLDSMTPAASRRRR